VCEQIKNDPLNSTQNNGIYGFYKVFIDLDQCSTHTKETETNKNSSNTKENLNKSDKVKEPKI
jgi:hypothetical protein